MRAYLTRLQMYMQYNADICLCAGHSVSFHSQKGTDMLWPAGQINNGLDVVIPLYSLDN